MKVAKPNETEAMYQKNFGLMTSWVRSALSEIPDGEVEKKVEVTYNEEGYPVCRYHRDGECFHITSEHPLREAETWVRSIRPQDSAEIFLYGCGFGYPLFELFRKKPPHTVVVVFEQDLCLFKAMLRYFDFSPLVMTKKLVFFIGDSSRFRKVFLDFFCSVVFFITTYPTVLFTFPSVRNFKKEYLKIHRDIFTDLSFLTSNIGNSHQDSMLGLRNLLANTGEILKSPYLSCLKGKYRGVPAFIISNGPSLDKSIPLLREIQGRGLMICSESAIVPLTKHGIKPDVLTVLERTKANYLDHFQGRHYSPDIALLALTMADPRIFSSFSGEKIPVFRQGEEMNCWFNARLGDGSELNAGSSVAHMATSAAIYLGADPIVFVGQDLAYGPGGVTHGKDAFVSKENRERVDKTLHSIPTVYVEGNNGEMIPSNQLWEDFRIGLENIVANCPERRFYNATEGGAKIRGTEWAELSGLIRQYCTEPLPEQVGKLIAEERAKLRAAEREEKSERINAELHRTASLFRNLADETNRKKLECDQMMLLCAEKDEEKYRDVLDHSYRENIDLFYRYMEDNLCRAFFQQLTCAYFYLINRLGEIDSQGKREQVFDLHRQFFHDLRVICQSLSVAFEEAARSPEAVPEEKAGKAAGLS